MISILYDAGLSELSVTALSAISAFHHLTACGQYKSEYTCEPEYIDGLYCPPPDCDPRRLCSLLLASLRGLPSSLTEHLSVLHRHLLRGAVLISLGQQQLRLAEQTCPGS